MLGASNIHRILEQNESYPWIALDPNYCQHHNITRNWRNWKKERVWKTQEDHWRKGIAKEKKLTSIGDAASDLFWREGDEMEGRILVVVFRKLPFEGVVTRAWRIFTKSSKQLCKSFYFRASVIQQPVIENTEKPHGSWVLEEGKGDPELKIPNAKDPESQKPWKPQNPNRLEMEVSEGCSRAGE